MQSTGSSRPVAIVTGGGRGIGAAIASHLAQDDYQVVITGRTSGDLVAGAGRMGADFIVSDVTVPGSAESVVDQVIQRHGRLDVLVNNAGIAGSGGPLSETNVDSWWEVMTVNVYGPMAHMRSALRHMIPNGSGTIFNICSYAATRPTPGNSAYGASKAALARLTDSVAAECQTAGVAVLNLSPGLVDTDMTRGVPIFQGLPPEDWDPIERIGQLVVALLDRPDLHDLTGRFVHFETTSMNSSRLPTPFVLSPCISSR